MTSLEKQTHQDFIIYLVDNGSEGEDQTVLKENYANNGKVQLIFNKDNLGFTKGNNEVLRKHILPNHSYEYVLLLNNDTLLQKDWIEQLVKSAQKNQAHIVSSKMINYFDRTKMDNVGHRMLNTGEILPIGFNEPIENFTTSFENMGACAGAALYDVEMLRKIDVFDEYFTTGYEDAEIGVRANILGYKTIYEPKAIVYHKISQSVSKIWNYDYIKQIQVNTYYTYLKLMPTSVLLINLPFNIFKFLSIIFISLFTFRKKLLQVYLDGIYTVFFKEWKIIIKCRRNFFHKHFPIKNRQILKKMKFFLWFDLQRFFNNIIVNRKTTFEKW